MSFSREAGCPEDAIKPPRSMQKPKIRDCSLLSLYAALCPKWDQWRLVAWIHRNVTSVIDALSFSALKTQIFKVINKMNSKIALKQKCWAGWSVSWCSCQKAFNSTSRKDAAHALVSSALSDYRDSIQLGLVPIKPKTPMILQFPRMCLQITLRISYH